MNIRSVVPTIALLVSIVASLVGCIQRTPAEQAKATEKVLQEIGVVPDPAKPVETQGGPDVQKPLAPSIVKQATGNLPGASGDESVASVNASDSRAAIEPAPSPKPTPKPTITVDDPSLKWIAAEEMPRETWEVQYFGNSPVGFFHRKIDVSKTLGPSYFRHEVESRIRVSLKGKSQEQRIKVMTIERDNGELVTIEGSLEMGLNKQSFKGNISQDVLRLTGDENGQPYSVNIEWRKDYRGPFAVDQSMLRRPLQPRETRKLRYFDPILKKIIDGRLEASDYIMTPTLFGGSKELLEVRNIGIYGEDGSQSLLWVDKKGEGFKSYVQANDVLSFRTEPIAAQVVASIADLRAIEFVSIPLNGPVDRLTSAPGELASIVFRISHRSEEPYRMFADRTGQRIRSIDPKTVEVTVFKNGGELAPLLNTDIASKVDAGTLASSEFVPKNTPQVQKLAAALIASDKTLSPDIASNSDKANTCRRELQKRMSLKDFDKHLGSITDSLRSRQANCVEQALLLASTCRALDIPARIAMGVKFNRSTEAPAMIFHAWIEIRDEARWVPMDSTDDAFPTPLDRIKIQESNFNGPNPYLEILNVYRLLPELDIQVIPR